MNRAYHDGDTSLRSPFFQQGLGPRFFCSGGLLVAP